MESHLKARRAPGGVQEYHTRKEQDTESNAESSDIAATRLSCNSSECGSQGEIDLTSMNTTVRRC